MERIKSTSDLCHRTGEKGQALPLVLIVLTVGALVISPFLSNVGTSLSASRIFGQRIQEQYSSDSGVEHAIWNLLDGSLKDQLTVPGNSTNYTLSESINGVTPAITASNAWETMAADDFESGTWSGGTGWLAAWDYQGDAGIVTTGNPYEGIYHMQLTADTGYAKRSVDVSGPSAHLQFWAKVNSFASGGSAQCLVSSNGTGWTAVRTWTYADGDSIYHFYDIDLTSYTLSSQFWIAFKANMSGIGDYLCVDNLKVLWVFNSAPTLASDDLETGTWSGGTGWLAEWDYQGDASVIATDTPYQGSYHLRLRTGTGYVQRSVDLSAQSSARLQFWAKANSFEHGETAQCLVSPNGTDWTVVRTWVDGDDDNTYRFYGLDLSSYTLSSEFWIAFRANMSDTDDQFYVDDLSIEGTVLYGVTSRAGNEIIKAVVRMIGNSPSLLSWWVK